MDIFNSKEPEKQEKKEFSNELDDIILDKKDKKIDIKKIALLAGSVILLLIIVISIVKITSGDNETENEDFFATESATPTEDKIDEDYKQVPIIKEETTEPEEKFEKIVEEVIEEQKTEDLQKTTPAQEFDKKPVKKTQQKKEIQADTKISDKKTYKTVTKGEYYIQVGAFYKFSPNKKFLDKIQKSGYDYIIKTVIKNSSEVKKVLIGPYKTRAEAKKALSSIKKTVKKDAFIVRIKE
ncbi:SPOR domain-containing protein [Nitrosophilus labii]|uniref:SPOR domain-containing protein n=1 Tax=Nitrosophilus labii TaxID=2706014 RepID=UPI0016570A30|nr:SPOR domain-containing protein [Nitrosophilus labii]